ncbi:uncharacterized protein EV422DRAFT_513494 [Fimicolochytrium jonesii]|uniref:uncharacterized protein n=1 Tax=Fimicolochytrium jonesii TaxID=1396493 RepID=UPI0022FEF326|nr:uncharacterized protein EV422DRAFT_513494 [Fimicolochytrium jonesii]KAI8825605.1 hypothetical protein EV422DRAFT_513494 [Fimicolochytrium jonesii]
MGLFGHKKNAAAHPTPIHSSSGSASGSASGLHFENTVALPAPLPPPPTLSSAPPIPGDGSVDPEDPLQIAIFYHEQNVLDVAAYYFSVAAARGHPVGLFMYAMSMRHGWGCPKDEVEAVQLLQKAAETAVMDLNMGVGSGRSNKGSQSASALKKVATTELTLAIYELAMSFKQGWGVPKSKTTSVYYLAIAAQLGDVDAQQELGECYLRGDGVKRDKKVAAKWFREAEKQGAKMVSMQWIWKDKYNP